MSPPAPGAGPTFHARRRARKACIGCRKRKVRCDVTVKGSPCTNCQLDCQTCVVKGRASRRYLADQADPYHHSQLGVGEGTQGVFDSVYTHPVAEETESGPLRSGVSLEPFDELDEAADAPSPLTGGPGETTQPSERASPAAVTASSDHDSSPKHPPQQIQCKLNVTGSVPASGAMMVLYTSYPFLTINNSASLSPEDLAFLEIKGALHVPVKSMLDEFVRQYFLHVHPFLPLVDEGEFWSSYRQDERANSARRIPLMLFQAMIFASCSFVPEAVTKSLGYGRIRSARSAFYHNARLLYDFSTENSPVVIAQTAALMTLWCPPEAKPIQSNSMWLQIAIQHARFVDAHLAWETSFATDYHHSHQEPQMLRRLWWCCLVRDRFLSLGLRRTVQVAKSQPLPYMSDFEGEIGRSEVHTAETKQLLVRMFLRVTHLCNILTDPLLLAWPPDDPSGLQPQSPSTLTDCRTALREWYDKSQLEISTANGGSGVRQHSVIVHTNLMYIFYYAARSVISRQEVLLNCYQPQSPALDLSSNYERSREVQEAALGTVECLRELIQLDLTRYLPLSALAFIAIPLLFHILDAKFLYLDKVTTDLEARHRRLRVLIDAMREYRQRYDGVEWFSYALRYAVNLAQFHSPYVPKSSVASSTDLLTQQPSLCLRLTLTIELSLSQAKIPDDRDFPIILRGVLGPKLNLVRELTLEGPNATQNVQVSSAQHSDLELVTGPSENRNSSEITSEQMESCPQPQINEDMSFEKSPVTGEDLMDKDEQIALQELILSFPDATASSKDDGQTPSPIDPSLSQPLMEPFDFLSYDDLVGSGCDFDIMTNSSYVDTGVY
ncbi:fungal-specific transcription factor [Ilyonectria destructans]|nr:fungal-specific transcription factor [Ilyonectria destructans]